MSINSKLDFFAVAPRLREAEVEIPGTGKTVRVRELTVGQRIEFERRAKARTEAEIASCLLIASAIDESGAPLFTQDDEAALNALSLNVFPPFMKALTDLNALSAQDVEDAEKN
ncbi:hypothetical protein [Paludisphaera sp.]|uniref:hypothetical protein n=1 Tax=Paludisphaera sp. TaxID=2017432 RepID=UPI00301BE6CB